MNNFKPDRDAKTPGLPRKDNNTQSVEYSLVSKARGSAGNIKSQPDAVPVTTVEYMPSHLEHKKYKGSVETGP